MASFIGLEYEKQTKMRFGKYKDRTIYYVRAIDSPYFDWCKNKMFNEPHRRYLFKEHMRMDFEQKQMEEKMKSDLTVEEEKYPDHVRSVMFLDCESTGFGINENKLVQLGYIITDEDFKPIKGANRILKHSPPLQDYYKTIPFQMIEERGISQNKLNKKFLRDLKKYNVKTLIAHNSNFDVTLLKRFTTVNFDDYEIICTMKKTKEMSPLKDKLGRQKVFKQEELYEHLFNKKANQTHNGFDDVIMLLKICRRLKKNGDF